MKKIMVSATRNHSRLMVSGVLHTRIHLERSLRFEWVRWNAHRYIDGFLLPETIDVADEHRPTLDHSGW